MREGVLHTAVLSALTHAADDNVQQSAGKHLLSVWWKAFRCSHPELTHLFTSTPKTRYAQRDPYHISVLMIPDETGQALVSYWCWRYLCVRFTRPSFFSSLICLLLPGLETCMLRTQPVVVHSRRITVNSHLELTHLRVYTPQDSVFPEIDDFHTVLMV